MTCQIRLFTNFGYGNLAPRLRRCPHDSWETPAAYVSLGAPFWSEWCWIGGVVLRAPSPCGWCSLRLCPTCGPGTLVTGFRSRLVRVNQRSMTVISVAHRVIGQEPTYDCPGHHIFYALFGTVATRSWVRTSPKSDRLASPEASSISHILLAGLPTAIVVLTGNRCCEYAEEITTTFLQYRPAVLGGQRGLTDLFPFICPS